MTFRPHLVAPAERAALRDLELLARTTVEGLRQGLHRSPFHGYSAEFSQYRHYIPGDDLKYVDWKAFARTDRLYSRQFRETTNLGALFVIDASRSMDFGASQTKFALAAAATAVLGTLVIDQCAGGPWSPIRLWPDGGPGRFRGTLVAASTVGECRIDAALLSPARATASARFRVSEDPAPAFSDVDELSGSVAAHGGTVVHAGDETALVTRLRASAASSRISVPVRPMRSPWWIAPFASCLAGEWWLRRRRGLR